MKEEEDLDEEEEETEKWETTCFFFRVQGSCAFSGQFGSQAIVSLLLLRLGKVRLTTPVGQKVEVISSVLEVHWDSRGYLPI